ncbi:hypothetical protein [Nonomuraea wenchangensis]|uniref:Uncharacterized protein n=1 Tax=Nonomuraea wenchangensis TaxID=568860 RepID=A0A1I0EEX4_9ACTN|nr:hypothetical protein [Nonomuraea wenchangensis]SET43719.1 hypothetical protein SAMN05421811_10322 [Nonomuraea wenchangensis]
MPISQFAGWLTVPYSGHDLSRVFIAVGDPNDWRPAFLDWADGERVAKIRPPAPTGKAVKVWLKVNDSVTEVGKVIH